MEEAPSTVVTGFFFLGLFPLKISVSDFQGF